MNIMKDKIKNINIKDQVVNIKDQVIKRKDKVVKIKDQVIKRKDKVVKMKDKVIKRKDKVVKMKDKVIKRTDKVVLKKVISEREFILHFEAFKYPKGIICPRCNSQQIYKARKYPKQRRCGSCQNRFSIFQDTVFGHTKISFKKWLYVIHSMTDTLEGKEKSILQISREIGASYKTCWRLVHKIREAMSDPYANRKLFKFIEKINKNYILEDAIYTNGKIAKSNIRERKNIHNYKVRAI